MRFSFLSIQNALGETAFMPFVPLALQLEGKEIKTHGLLDTGAAINVMPFSIGKSLGAIWEQQTISLRLAGNLSSFEARVLIVKALIEGCPPTDLAFAWTQAENVPLLLGQTNFFMEFDAFFARSELFFEVLPKGSST